MSGGYVDEGTAGYTELRVHGVSGTPPESMLEYPWITRVAGDANAGFYRRVWPTAQASQDDAESRREAYSWGGLTSGSNKRALWLLLLPFMLVNIAFFMGPRRLDDDPPGWGPRIEAAAQRLLAFSLTVTFVLSAVAVSMDLVGWQCGNGPALGGTQRCAGGAGWLRWLDYSWLRAPGRHLALTALVPVLLVAVLWYLGSSTWAVTEAQLVPQIEPGRGREPQVDTPLEDRRLWNGRAPVRRLRALHVAGGFTITGVFILAPLLADSHRGLPALFDAAAWSGPLPAVRTALVLVLLVALAVLVVLVATPWAGRRERPRPGRSLPAENDWLRVLPWAALAVMLGAAVVAWFPSANGATPTAQAELPWAVSWIHGLFLVQVALLLVLLATWWSARRQRQTAAEDAPAWGGLGGVGVALLGWLLAGGLAAGLMLRAAQTLGTPAVAGHRAQAPTPLFVPTVIFWAGAAAVAAAAGALAIGVSSWMRIHRKRRSFDERVDRLYPSRDSALDADNQRLRQISGTWASAQWLETSAQGAGGLALMWICAVLIAAGALYGVFGTRLVTGAPQLVTIANLTLTAFVAGLVWAGRKAYDNEGFRRTVGILWDLGTFWPRATHPFAPPCYAERTIPDLLMRVEYLTQQHPTPSYSTQSYSTQPKSASADPGRVVLSCHSQGSVIGSVVVLQARTEAGTNTSLLTYGCPVTRIYSRFFPVYFNQHALECLGGILTTPDTAEAPAEAPARPAHGRWRWRNLYRLSDPIGGWVIQQDEFPDGAATETGHSPGIDHLLLDPLSFDRPAGNPSYPPPLGHSDYFADPVFDGTVHSLGAAPAAPTVPTALPPPPVLPAQPDQPNETDPVR
ncbi:MAG TPA: hypothetical protein VFU73_12290 [Actinocrinis sp.]|nr:hypothetical protein [Actinocrinis sp.]